MNINGTTQKIGIIGWPVGHSFSPCLHNAAFDALGLNYVYVPLPVEKTQLADAVKGLLALGFAGANVTVPHKVAIMEYLDEVDPVAEKIGAVNTLVVRQKRVIGYNTDALGFMAALHRHGFSANAQRVMLLGAGGAARAIAAGVSREQVKSFTIAARRLEQAQNLAATLPDFTFTSVGWPSNDFSLALSQADIIIHSTPIGMFPHSAEQPSVDIADLKASALVCDLIYNPVKTRLLQIAAAAGHPVLGGMSMLIEQAAAAFELWTGENAPRSVMEQAVQRLLDQA